MAGREEWRESKGQVEVEDGGKNKQDERGMSRDDEDGALGGGEGDDGTETEKETEGVKQKRVIFLCQQRERESQSVTEISGSRPSGRRGDKYIQRLKALTLSRRCRSVRPGAGPTDPVSVHTYCLRL